MLKIVRECSDRRALRGLRLLAVGPGFRRGDVHGRNHRRLRLGELWIRADAGSYL
jgi:hypothetical protein